MSLRVLDGSVELSCVPSSCPRLWRWLQLQGRCSLCEEWIQALVLPVLFVLGRGLMKQVRASGLHGVCDLISCSSFILIHDFSSTSLDNAKSRRVCDLEIKILAASRQKCLQDSIGKVPMLITKSLVQLLGFLQGKMLFLAAVG